MQVNGSRLPLTVEPRISLLDALREQAGLTGTKKGCDRGACGACTVHIDGRRVVACLTLAARCQGKAITTIEGLASAGRPHPVQEAFVDHHAIQCGFCASGMILTAKALLDQTPDPTEIEIRHALSGNICRCTGYAKIVEAVKTAAAKEK